jgi:dihydrofolate reductase
MIPKPPMKLTAIVAMTPERVIGLNGSLPWHLPADLAFFKRTTSGHPVVMGRTTFESIGRPLPNRRNIVLTRDPAWRKDGVDVIPTPAALDTLGLSGEIFIIGGSQVYQAFLPRLDEILVSHIHHPYPGDTFLPAFEKGFADPEIVEAHPDFTVLRYTRIPAA